MSPNVKATRYYTGESNNEDFLYAAGFAEAIPAEYFEQGGKEAFIAALHGRNYPEAMRLNLKLSGNQALHDADDLKPLFAHYVIGQTLSDIKFRIRMEATKTNMNALYTASNAPLLAIRINRIASDIENEKFGQAFGAARALRHRLQTDPKILCEDKATQEDVDLILDAINSVIDLLQILVGPAPGGKAPGGKDNE